MTPFNIHIDEAILIHLQQRLAQTRWADHIADDIQRGIVPSTLRTLIDRWQQGYDWKATEQRLNLLSHYTFEGIHFVRAGTKGKQPLLLIHGWPDSFLRFERIIPFLENDFDLIIPSIPGFGFSDRPLLPGMGAKAVAGLFDNLMQTLGIEKYAIAGGDWGAIIAELMAAHYSDHVTSLYLTDLAPWHNLKVDKSTLTEEEQTYLSQVTTWAQREGAYVQIQITKPQTLAYGLNDSPVGMAAWLVEKFDAWSDGGVHALGIDAVLDQLTLYWVTETAASAARFYYEMAATMGPVPKVTVPIAFGSFPKDMKRIPRSFVERAFNVQQWTDMPAGGHFTAWEQPELMANDIRQFFL